MEPSRYIGRVGGLAVALGVGAAVFTGGGGTAWAEPDSSVSAGSSRERSVRPTTHGPESAAQFTTGGRTHSTKRENRPEAIGTQDLRSRRPLPPERKSQRRTPRPRRRNGPVGVIDKTDKTETKTPADMASRPTLRDRPRDAVPRLDRSASPLSSRSIVRSFLATRPSVVAALPDESDATSPGHAVSSVVARVPSRVLRPFAADSSPGTPPVNSPAEFLPLAAIRRGLSGARVSLDQPSATAASPTLVLNGYNIVASSVENVVSFYGLFTIPPGTPGVVQGSQEFDVVDPDSGDTVGSFDALVTNSDTFFLGRKYRQLYVTDAAVEEGADPNATPLPGTLIASITFDKKGRFGTLYTSTPSDTGNVVSLKFVTPRRDFRIPFRYDGLPVFEAVSIPVRLTDEYYIAPAPDSPQRLISIAGAPPFYSVAQGEQVFNVYQTGNDVPLGSFRGYFTTTSDALGAFTEAILVAETISGPVGTEPWQVPSVGAVYNVIYPWNILYSGIPSDSGPPVIKTTITTRFGDIPLPLRFFDATTIPDFGSS